MKKDPKYGFLTTLTSLNDRRDATVYPLTNLWPAECRSRRSTKLSNIDRAGDGAYCLKPVKLITVLPV